MQPTSSPSDPTELDDPDRPPRPRGGSSTPWPAASSPSESFGTSFDTSVSPCSLPPELDSQGHRGLEDGGEGHHEAFGESSRMGRGEERDERQRETKGRKRIELTFAFFPFPSLLPGAPPAITSTHEYQAMENEWMRERNVSLPFPFKPHSGRERD